jgi:hypothetical protein
MDKGQGRLRDVCNPAFSRQMVEESRTRSFKRSSTYDRVNWRIY